MSYFKELKDLEDEGIDLIELLGQDRPLESPEDLQKIAARLGRGGDDLHGELLYYLTHRRFPPAQSVAIWRGIMKHKRRMSEALHRSVSFRVAALDFLTAKSAILRNVRLIGKPELEGILSFVNRDEVTAVHNRRYFNEVLGQEVHRARRYGKSLSLLILDLDNFKKLNDTRGHPEGDAVLRRVGRLLRDNTRQTDIVCRYGGDEFAVLLPETNGSDAYTLAERIRRAPERPAVPGPRGPLAEGVKGPHLRSAREEEGGPPITFSIGVATYPTDCEEAEELVAVADQMCLDAKRQGKDRVCMAGGEKGLPLAAE
jgi:diguanylate cyclase (GGDEF)-like protein